MGRYLNHKLGFDPSLSSRTRCMRGPDLQLLCSAGLAESNRCSCRIWLREATLGRALTPGLCTYGLKF